MASVDSLLSQLRGMVAALTTGQVTVESIATADVDGVISTASAVCTSSVNGVSPGAKMSMWEISHQLWCVQHRARRRCCV